MEIKLITPPGCASPWALQSYDMDITELKFDVECQVHENPISDKETMIFSQVKHGTSRISLKGILTADSVIPGSTVEDKKNNLITAAASWWHSGGVDVKDPADCMQLYWRGWVQYVIIDRLECETIAGDDIECEYNMTLIVNEG